MTTIPNSLSGPISLAVDAMSGDLGVVSNIDGSLTFAQQYSDVHLILVGDPSAIQSALDKQSAYAGVKDQISLHPATEIVDMQDSPASALRNKKDSSMRIAINLVKEGKAQACVSAGNTGALMATARFVLKMVSGIDRPAICTAIPATDGHHTHVMDLGANVDCSSEHLYQFALMGSELVKAIDSNPAPRVALLNIGEEDIKGNDQVKQASQLLQQDSHLNYIGYVEGNDIFTNKADVVVTDGFVGNVALKTMEGVARMIGKYMEEEFKRTPLNKLAGWLSMPVIKAFRQRIDPRAYNGASLLGLQGIVIKSHGSADKMAFANAMKIAVLEVQNNVVASIEDAMYKGVQRRDQEKDLQVDVQET